MSRPWSEYTPAVGFSLAVHAAIITAAWAVAHVSWRPAPQTIKPLGIDAVVVDARSLRPSAPAPAAPAPSAAPAPPPSPPAPTVADRQEQAALAKQRIADAQKAADTRKAEASRQAEEARRVEEARRADEARRAEEARKAMDAQRAAEAKRAADAKAKSDREAELRRQLADEEHVQAVENGPLSASYYAVLQARMTRAWIKPPSAGPGIDCRVEVTQVPGGEVVGARVTQCNGDAAVRQSIENAVYRSSPLPEPPDPALFHRVFTVEFKPNE